MSDARQFLRWVGIELAARATASRISRRRARRIGTARRSPSTTARSRSTATRPSACSRSRRDRARASMERSTSIGWRSIPISAKPMRRRRQPRRPTLLDQALLKYFDADLRISAAEITAPDDQARPRRFHHQRQERRRWRAKWASSSCAAGRRRGASASTWRNRWRRLPSRRASTICRRQLLRRGVPGSAQGQYQPQGRDCRAKAAAIAELIRRFPERSRSTPNTGAMPLDLAPSVHVGRPAERQKAGAATVLPCSISSTPIAASVAAIFGATCSTCRPAAD